MLTNLKSILSSSWLFLSTIKKPYDFRSSLSIKECIAQLDHQFRHKKHWLYGPVVFELYFVDIDNCKFTVRKIIGGGLFVDIAGQLQQWDKQSTTITGYGNVSGLTQTLLIIFSIIPTLSLSIFLIVIGGFWLALIDMLIPITLWIYCLRARDKLIRDLHNILVH